ncbi:MAG: hypothetical protein CVV64_15000 [Candidatus Wallbacteria bacterium HGW-Wallbacteria-1]|jgi:hypothetical protein|uniref:Uncharacterized protein n=1 Tax=Candidatus Wallbacteria bacterium HGW-Wallbacteria-1 TaxID=2013854 RepID=A0A2N1PLS1_9BACT|nr:MAG: hypothetical protein CVV64_15000 [Candidatus Wallbacteria bacterium HGW-Wallbacteria-1]
MPLFFRNVHGQEKENCWVLSLNHQIFLYMVLSLVLAVTAMSIDPVPESAMAQTAAVNGASDAAESKVKIRNPVMGTVSFMKLFFAHPLVKSRFNLADLRFDVSKDLEQLRRDCDEYQRQQTRLADLDGKFRDRIASLKEKARKAVYEDPLATGTEDRGFTEDGRKAEEDYWAERRAVQKKIAQLSAAGVGPVVERLLQSGEEGLPALELFLNGNMMNRVMIDLRMAIASAARSNGVDCVFNLDVVRSMRLKNRRAGYEAADRAAADNPSADVPAAENSTGEKVHQISQANVYGAFLARDASLVRGAERIEKWWKASDRILQGPMAEFDSVVSFGDEVDITTGAMDFLAAHDRNYQGKGDGNE